MGAASRSAGPPWLAIALLSAVVLAYEVLLTRLFSIIQWHHFSHMIISLALLGYGVSGSFLTLIGPRLREHFGSFFVINAGLFAISAVTGFLLAQQVPFNALEIAWDGRQLVYLLAIYLTLAVPFFCAANCIGATFMRYPAMVHRVYGYDLAGAGAGALGVIALLYLVAPLPGLAVLGAAGLLAAALAAVHYRARTLGAAAALIGVLGVGSLSVDSWWQPRLSEYKDLSQALKVVGAERLIERSGPLGVVTVVGNQQVPLRFAPGMSLASGRNPPAQLGLFSDGNAAGAIVGFTGQWSEVAYLNHLTSALPYHLLSKPRVLVLGAGGGADVLQALYHRAHRVDAVELNPQIVKLVRDEFGRFTGGVYDRADVRIHVGEARGFISGSSADYDLIQVALLDAFSTAAAGLYALTESYLYTVEALQEYLRHLRPGGMLTLTRWLRTPPRDGLKLFATAAAALEGSGVSDPGARLALIRGLRTSTLIVKNGRLNNDEIEALRRFCRERSFDVAYFPGITANQANRFNILAQPYFFEGTQAILGPEKHRFFQRYKLDVRPATDDRPYFFHFLRPTLLPELLAMRSRGGLGQLEWGYVVLLATLVQAVLAGIALILLPLWLGRRGALATVESGTRWRVLGYFSCIGLGFLFLEIAFIQKFVLYLSHPLYSMAVVLCAFLIFAGVGSGYSRRLEYSLRPGFNGRASLRWAIAGLTVLAVAYLAVLPVVFQWTLSSSELVRIVITVLLIAPLAFFMGMPFPVMLGEIARTHGELVPWAWAINGCASVVSAVLALILAMAAGFSWLVASAVVLYWVAAMVAPWFERRFDS